MDREGTIKQILFHREKDATYVCEKTLRRRAFDSDGEIYLTQAAKALGAEIIYLN